MPRKREHPAWATTRAKPAGKVGKAIAGVRMLQADVAYGRAAKTGDRRAVTAAATRMRTAQKRAGITADPAKLVGIGQAVKAKAAYDKAVASGNKAAIRRAGNQLRGLQKRAGVEQDRDRNGRFA